MQEVFFALVGHTGGLILETEDRFVVNPSTKFLAEAERHVIERIVQAGFYCKRLGDFAESTRRQHFKSSLRVPTSEAPDRRATAAAQKAEKHAFAPGHCMYALSCRVEEILDGYRGRVVTLEAEVTQDPALPLAHLECRTEEDRRVLRSLHSLVDNAKAKHLAGGPLLDFLWVSAANHAGTGSIYESLWSAVSGAGQVLTNQLIGWMVYGRLVDPHGDFFIGRAWDHQPRWESGCAIYGGPVDNFAKQLDAAVAQREWSSVFFLKAEDVPQAVLSLETAKKILFVGKAVRVLLRSNKWLPQILGDADGAVPLEGSLEPPEVQQEVDALRGCFDTKSPTHVVERAVERIRASAALQLRQLVVEEAALGRHLKALKGFYLLGYGDFYQTFLEEAHSLLSHRPPPHAEAALAHGPWAAAAAELEATQDRSEAWRGAPAPGAGTGGSAQRRARSLASRFDVRFVPAQMELQSFNDCARQVKLVGMARLAGGTAELGLGQGDGGSAVGSAAQSAMLWLATRQRVVRSFGHSFSFQLHAPALGSAVTDYGCRFAWVCQHRWAPSDLQRWRHLDGAEALLGGGGTTSASDRSRDRLAPAPTWTTIGECLAVEVSCCAAPTAGGGDPSGEVTLGVYVCQPGFGDDGSQRFTDEGRRGAGLPLVHRLATGSRSVALPRGKVHTVKLEYSASHKLLLVYFGSDVVEPVCSAEVDLSEVLSLDLGSAYLGLCLMPLDHRHRLVGAAAGPTAGARYASRDRPVSITSWSHEVHSRGDAAGSPKAGERRGVAEQGFALDVWFSSMELSYRVPWPLPLVITQSSLEQYNSLFKLLLAFRHVHLELQELVLPRTDLLPWALRAELAFFVSQVLQYFQQDVIEAAHRKLLHTVDKSRDFDLVVCAHEDFLASVTAHCFLRTPELHDALMAALRVAALFCRLAATPMPAAASATATGAAGRSRLPSVLGSRAAELRRLQAEFLNTVRSVLRMMNSMHKLGMHTQLSQLLLRLDYNGYFSGDAAGDDDH